MSLAMTRDDSASAIRELALAVRTLAEQQQTLALQQARPAVNEGYELARTVAAWLVPVLVAFIVSWLSNKNSKRIESKKQVAQAHRDRYEALSKIPPNAYATLRHKGRAAHFGDMAAHMRLMKRDGSQSDASAKHAEHDSLRHSYALKVLESAEAYGRTPKTDGYTGTRLTTMAGDWSKDVTPDTTTAFIADIYLLMDYEEAMAKSAFADRPPAVALPVLNYIPEPPSENAVVTEEDEPETETQEQVTTS